MFICKYWKVDEAAAATDQRDGKRGDDNEAEDAEEEGENSIECKLYFWKGRDANNAGWLTFTFTLKNKFNNIEIIKLNQQQESPQFLSHFKRKFIIHKGKRKPQHSSSRKHSLPPPPPPPAAIKTDTNSNLTKMFQLRKNPHSAICTRCIQLDTAQAKNLCSQFCFIVCVPFENSDKSNTTKGIVYVWIGSKSNPDEARLAEEIAQCMYEDSYSIQVLNEGEEPETFFWHGLEGKKHYDTVCTLLSFIKCLLFIEFLSHYIVGRLHGLYAPF